MSEQKQPDPNKPWCTVCREHTIYRSRQPSHESARGPLSYTHTCMDCDNVMRAPNAWVYLRTTFGCTGVVLFLFSIVLLVWKDSFHDFLLILGILFGPVGFVVCGVVMWLNNRKFASWMTWARERGYTDEDYKKSTFDLDKYNEIN